MLYLQLIPAFVDCCCNCYIASADNAFRCFVTKIHWIRKRAEIVGENAQLCEI